MKYLIIFFCIPLVSFAESGVVDSGGAELSIAEWRQDTKEVVLHGDVAKKLYLDLDAFEVVDEGYEAGTFSLKDHELRVKENRFATCKALKERKIIGGDSTKMVTKSVTCYLKAPTDTVL